MFCQGHGLWTSEWCSLRSDETHILRRMLSLTGGTMVFVPKVGGCVLPALQRLWTINQSVDLSI